MFTIDQRVLSWCSRRPGGTGHWDLRSAQGGAVVRDRGRAGLGVGVRSHLLTWVPPSHLSEHGAVCSWTQGQPCTWGWGWQQTLLASLFRPSETQWAVTVAQSSFLRLIRRGVGVTTAGSRGPWPCTRPGHLGRRAGDCRPGPGWVWEGEGRA